MKPPVLFVGHGSPLNAVSDNAFTRALRRLGRDLPRPRAVLCVSAHWTTEGVRALSAQRPRTIHDFYGFPEELYRIRYPAPGDPGLARRTVQLLEPFGARLSDDWGLDHGAWGTLLFLLPAADVPVVPLSLDLGRTPEEHFELAKALRPLRDEGVMIVGSGNIVHNLREMGPRAAPPPDWASEFDAGVAQALTEGDRDRLVRYERSFPGSASRSAPTPEHFLPLLYGTAAADGDPASFPYEGFEHGSVSLRCVRWG